MRSHRARLLLCSGAISLLVANAAAAQTAPAPSPEPEAAASEDIVVNGIRASLKTAQDVKRLAPSVIEAITPQDLGRFTDPSIADAISRVPGLQIQRNDIGDGGDRVSIRGLGPSFVVTTLNGRDVLSFGDDGYNLRSFNLDSVPSEILGEVRIYKTPTADLVEPGIAGEVDLRTLRPLDAKTRHGRSVFGSLNVSGVIDDIEKKVGPRVSGVLGGKFFNNTLGAYVSFVGSEQFRGQEVINDNQYGEAVVPLTFANANGTTTTRNVFIPGGLSYNKEDRRLKRLAVSGGVQWKPSENLEINADYTYNQFKFRRLADNLTFAYSNSNAVGSDNFFGSDRAGANRVLQPGAVTLTPNNDAVASFDTSKQPGNPFVVANAGAIDQNNKSELNSGGINVVWKNDTFKVTGDYAHSKLRFFYRYQTFYVDTAGTSTGRPPVPPFNISYVDSGSGVPTINAGAGLQAALATGGTAYFANEQPLKSDRDSFRVDLEGKVSENTTLKFGVRYVETKIDVRNDGNSFYAPPGQQTALDRAVRTGSTASVGGVSFPTFSVASGCTVIPTICAKTGVGVGSFVGDLPQSAAGSPDDALKGIGGFYGPVAYISRENTLSAYGQLESRGEIAGLEYSGNVGVRAIRVQLNNQGYNSIVFPQDPIIGGQATDPPSQGGLNSATNSYWKYLPSLNLTLKPVHNINLRFGVAKTISLPQYLDTVPNSSVIFYTNPSYPDIASGGNIKLKPQRSWNYDFTAEYYTKFGGSVIFSAFYKDVKDLIRTGTSFNATVANQPGTFTFSGPLNAPSGHAYGFELGTNLPLTFLSSPWDGFGVQSNFTYVISTSDPLPGDTRKLPFEGSSKYNANGVAYYEKYGFGARVAINYRSSYLQAAADKGLSIFTKAETSIDASLSYKLNEYVELIVSGSNLTGTDRFDGRPGIGNRFYYYANRPRTYTFSVRGSF